MIRSARPRLQDIDDNITLVLDLMHRRTLNHLTHDLALRYAVLYAVLIIAEAVNHLPDDLRCNHPDIPWRNIIAIGHKLRHEYHRIDTEIIWDVVTNHLMPLREAVRIMLANLEPTELPL